MWAFVLIFLVAAGEPSQTRAVTMTFATRDACVAANTWWLEHDDAGVSRGQALVSPGFCEPVAIPTS